MPSRPERTTPCSRYCSASFASASSFITRQPPSIVVMFLFAWKLNETKSPVVPIGLPFQLLPKDWAASSTTRSPWSFASAWSRSRSTGRPVRSTGMSARVFEVIVASTASRSRLRVTGSMSANTGRAPTSSTMFDVETQVSGDVITSSPSPMPAMRSAISIVQVPELNARTGRPPQYADNAASNSLTFGPDVIQPERSTSTTPAMVASSRVGRVNGRKGCACGFGLALMRSSRGRTRRR